MPLVYWDQEVTKPTGKHPGIKADMKCPTVRMVREAIDGKSTFHFTEQQALDLANYYLEGWATITIKDEFGAQVWDSDWKEMLGGSHYLEGKNKISEQTIQERWDAKKMEKELLDKIAEETKNSEED